MRSNQGELEIQYLYILLSIPETLEDNSRDIRAIMVDLRVLILYLSIR